MRVTRTFSVARSPEEVFDAIIGPELPDATAAATPAGGRTSAELVEHDRPRFGRMRIVAGTMRFDQTWSMEPDGHGGTNVEHGFEMPLRGVARLRAPTYWFIARSMVERTCELARRSLEDD